jgi:hypothetical protein
VTKDKYRVPAFIINQMSDKMKETFTEAPPRKTISTYLKRKGCSRKTMRVTGYKDGIPVDCWVGLKIRPWVSLSNDGSIDIDYTEMSKILELEDNKENEGIMQDTKTKPPEVKKLGFNE